MGVDVKKVRGLAAELMAALQEKEEEEETPEAKAAKGIDALKGKLMAIVGTLNGEGADLEKAAGQVVALADELRPKEPPKEAKAEDVEMGAQGAGDAVPSPGDGAPAPDAVNEAAEPAPLNLTAVKAISQDDKSVTVGGYLLLWGDPKHKDLRGDYFTPTTNLWLEQYKAAPCMFHHGLDDKVGMEVMGHRLESGVDEKGAWVKDWLDKSAKYWKFVQPLLEAEKLYYSPGSAPHLVERKSDGELKSFACIEDTLTPVPMQHRLRPLEEIRAAYKGAGLDLPAGLTGEAGAGSAPETDVGRWLAEQELALLAEE